MLEYFTNKRGLKIFHQNIRGIFTNFTKLEHLLDQCKGIDVLSLSETHIKTNTFNDNENLYKIRGYHFVQQCRKEGNGGGVAFYIKENLSWERRFDLETKTCENMWIEININKAKNLLCAVYYRPPNSSKFTSKTFSEHLNETLINVSKEQKEVIILGDFNVDYKKASDNKEIKDVFTLNGFTQIIKTPTRITKQSETIIDIINTNNPEAIANEEVFPMSISDHDLVGCVRKINNKTFSPKTITCRNYARYNPNSMADDLKKQNWNRLYEMHNVNDAVDYFNRTVMGIFDKHAPVVVKRVRGKPCEWLTHDIRKMKTDKDRLLKKARKTKNPDDWNLYKKLRNCFNNKLKSAKSIFYRNMLHELSGNANKFWKCIKKIFPSKTSHASTNVTKNQTFVDKCSQYFANAVYLLKKNTIILVNFTWKSAKVYRSRTENRFQMNYISNEFVLNQLKSFKRKKAAGDDGLPPGLLKDCRNQISKPLCYILNLSVRTCTVPTSWKIAKVVPIHKKGSSTDPANYRPISVLPALSKILEKAVHQQLTDFLENESLLTNNQFGYRRKRSTNLATTLFLDNIRRNVDQGYLVGAIFIDLSKAFDTISHGALLDKLPSYGVCGNELQWITNYLFERKQYVQIESFQSDLKPCLAGVPQGSILGPLLFILFFNDFPEVLEVCDTVMYADDTVITYRGKSITTIEVNLTDELKRIEKYLVDNELIINMNVGKTEVMLFGTAKRIAAQPRPLEVRFKEETVNNTNSYTYLGHSLDSNLILNQDFERAYKRTSCRLKLLAKLRSYLNKDAAMKIYTSTIIPILTYMLSVKIHLNDTQLKKLGSIERRGQQIIGKNVPSLRKTAKDRIVKIVNDCLNGEICSNFDNYFEIQDHNINTRNNRKMLKLPRCKLEFGKRSFYYLGAKFFNET